MENLQNLYDYYIKTKPSAGKIRTATTLLIRICKALNVDTPEEVSEDMYKLIPRAIDDFYKSSVHRALQDKSMLAEMIGRYGPREKWAEALDVLLADPDQNLRLFTLQSLIYYGMKDPLSILPYVERYVDSEDEELRQGAVNLLCKLLNSEKGRDIVTQIKTWSGDANKSYFTELLECLDKAGSSDIKASIHKWLAQ